MSSEFGFEPKLIKGDRGVFDVVADGNLVFSKHATGRFPENDEIVEALHSIGLGGPQP